MFKFTKRLEDVKDVFISYQTTFALKFDNTLWGCGRNNYNQLDGNSTDNITTFKQIAENVSMPIIFNISNIIRIT